MSKPVRPVLVLDNRKYYKKDGAIYVQPEGMGTYLLDCQKSRKIRALISLN